MLSMINIVNDKPTKAKCSRYICIFLSEFNPPMDIFLTTFERMFFFKPTSLID